jgi:ParB-like chromosome segregation protein Spo0J
MTNPFPDLPAEEYDALLEDIEKRGIVYPVIRDQGGITIDGHQREHVAAALGIEVPVKVIEVADDAERDELAVALNVHRRHLTPEARRAAILRLAPTGMTQTEIARHTGSSQQRVSQVLGEVTSTSNPPAPSDDLATDKQGRLPDERGGRPRGQTNVAPVWVRHFTLWCRRALPEDRAVLLKMRSEIDVALEKLGSTT